MADDYTTVLKISVSKGSPEVLEISEEKTFTNLSFAKMTKISAEYYELIAKLEKTYK